LTLALGAALRRGRIATALLILPAYAPALVTLVASLFTFGAVHGMLNIAMNTNAIEVEQAWARPIMSSFHAVYSIIGQPVAGVIGFGCFGAGMSCIAPLIFSAAGRHNPAQAGRAIARVASLGWIGFLTGPIVIGSVAELVGLARALLIPTVLALFVAVAARALHPRTPGHASIVDS
jgi:hypothetical protein